MVSKISYQHIPILNKLISDYLLESPVLQEFISGFANINDFEHVIENRKIFSTEQRELLVSSFEADRAIYSSEQLDQLNKLKLATTYTVVTAHQPNLLFGPLYFILKTVSAINLAKALNKRYPDSHVVPVFVLGSEDHDTEELNHLTIFKNKLTWENNQEDAFGRRTMDGLEAVRDRLYEIFGNSPYAEELKELLDNYYFSSATVGEATKLLLTKLFANEGLLVLDPDQAALKQSFVPVMKAELLHRFSNPLVEDTSAKLLEFGYPNQVSGRAINLFYLTDDKRIRIERVNDTYQLTDQSQQWTQEEMLTELEANPNRFSPNVILRPLYQEHILPNLAYVGGGGELSYWFQLKRVFDHQSIPFPILVLRNQVMVIKDAQRKKMSALGLSEEMFFKDRNDVINNWVKANGDVDVSLHKEEQVMRQIYEGIYSKYKHLDGSLKSIKEAQLQQQLKLLKGLEKRIFKLQKSRSDIQINQINKLFDSFMPNNTLLERQVSFMEFYLSNGAGFIQTLLNELDPLVSQFYIIELS